MPPMADNGDQSEFDTNFDAGVEADEDTDPKKYIQQLTGKLSQTISNYNNENGGEDEELNKYVANMIVAQVAKNMEEVDKKEIIKKINTSVGSEDDAEEEVPPMDGEEAPAEELPPTEEPTQEPIQECVTKRQIKEALRDQLLKNDDGEEDVVAKKKDKKTTVFDGKTFTK